MNWDAVGAVAEMVGAVAVVVSLIYVGAQIRQSNRLSRADTFYNSNVQYAALMSQISGDGDLAKIYRRAKLGEELEPDDLERFKAFLWSYFGFSENLYIQEESGLYGAELGATSIAEFMAPHFNRILTSNQACEWLRDEGKELLYPAFYEAVERYTDLNSESSGN